MIYSYFCSSFALLFVLFYFFQLLTLTENLFQVCFEGSRFDHITCFHMTSLVAQTVKHLPVMWETPVWSLGQEGPLEKEMATHSSILAWENPMDRGDCWATVHGASASHSTEHTHGRCHLSMTVHKRKRHHGWSRLWFKWACCLAMHPGRLWISVVGKYIHHTQLKTNPSRHTTT